MKTDQFGRFGQSSNLIPGAISLFKILCVFLHDSKQSCPLKDKSIEESQSLNVLVVNPDSSLLRMSPNILGIIEQIKIQGMSNNDGNKRGVKPATKQTTIPNSPTQMKDIPAKFALSVYSLNEIYREYQRLPR